MIFLYIYIAIGSTFKPQYKTYGKSLNLKSIIKFKLGVVIAWTIDYRDYVYGIGNGYISQDIPLNTSPQYIDMGMGLRTHKKPQNSPKIMKIVKMGSCYSIVSAS